MKRVRVKQEKKGAKKAKVSSDDAGLSSEIQAEGRGEMMFERTRNGM